MLELLKKNVGIIFISLVVVIFFKNLLNSFYQQDEWHGLGDILAYGQGSLKLNQNVFQILVGEGRIFANGLVYVFLGRFSFNIVPVAIFAIAFHLVNTALVYIISLRFLQNKITSLLVASFFAFSGVAHSAVTWVVSSTGTLPATTLILLSLLTFLKYLKTNKWTYLFLAFVLVYFSLFFKEIGIFLFIFYPFIFWFLKQTPILIVVKNFWLFLVFGAISGTYRVLSLGAVATQKDLFLTEPTRDYASTLVLRSILYPLISFSQNFVPHKYVFEAAKRIVWNYYEFFPNQIYDLLAQSAVLDTMSLLASGLILFLLFVLFRESNKDVKNNVLFWLGFCLLSILPYVVVGKTGSYLESRYYYLSVISTAILLGYILEKVFQTYGLGIRFISLTFVLFLLSLNIRFLRDEITRQQFLAEERIKILQQMIVLNERIDVNEMIYISGDRNFYITQGNPLPMQQGTGYTILTWYYAKGLAPDQARSLIGNYYLWEMGGQGFRKVEDFVYGYYWDLEKLREDVNSSGLNINNISGFYYDSNSQELTNISEKIRNEIEE
ncbi:MAG: hypothetical protein AAB685_02370 [Patescibacteria group bacterium]